MISTTNTPIYTTWATSDTYTYTINYGPTTAGKWTFDTKTEEKKDESPKGEVKEENIKDEELNDSIMDLIRRTKKADD